MRIPLLMSLGLLSACVTNAPFTLDGPTETPAGADLQALVQAGRDRVETFFGHPFAKPVRIIVSPTRAAFDASLPLKWGLTPTQCWMVGVGGGNLLALLSPEDWSAEACEHQATDAAHIQEIVAHELTHVFHGQHNPTGDFTGMDDAGWFVEGLAVVVSGQLTRSDRPSARQAIADNAAPSRLADAWAGKYRYGVSGSLVAFIDTAFGRQKLLDLMGAVTNAEILAGLGLMESEFLERWRTWVLKTV